MNNFNINLIYSWRWCRAADYNNYNYNTHAKQFPKMKECFLFIIFLNNYFSFRFRNSNAFTSTTYYPIFCWAGQRDGVQLKCAFWHWNISFIFGHIIHENALISPRIFDCGFIQMDYLVFDLKDTLASFTLQRKEWKLRVFHNHSLVG